MSMLKLLTAVGGNPTVTPYSDDVFSAYTFAGNSSTQTITNGIDLAGKGGMVWAKSRVLHAATENHALFDTARGVNKALITNDTLGSTNGSATQGVTAFNSDGFSLGTSLVGENYGTSDVSWSFRNSDRFFSHTSVVKSSGSNATVSFPGLVTLGMVAVKRTDSTGSWYVWHRSLTAGKLLYLEQTAAEATLGHITVSGTTVTLVNGVITDGTYIVYAWAHDTASDGIIQCGSFTTDASGNATVNLGWEPQFGQIKGQDTTSDWFMLDQSRAWVATASKDYSLSANTSAAEVTTANYGTPTATGFTVAGMTASKIYIYMVIRRPNKPPTVGTQVYNAIARTGTGAAATVTGVGFAPDLSITKGRSIAYDNRYGDRLRGALNLLCSSDTNSESTMANEITSFDMDGFTLGTGAVGGYLNTSARTYINHFFKRAPGFFDEVCDTGTGAAHTIAHNLTVAPELMIRKGRSGATQWEVWHSAIANTEKLVLNSTAAKATDTTAWNSTSPTASVFTVGTGANVNTNTATYVTYLFATLSGISKCGTYTGNGTTQNIEMGFTTGARFFLVKATSTTGNWVVFDSVRGIIAGSSPYLLLNSTSAEDTDEDAVDPYSGGITVNETSASNINTNSVVYCYLAIA